MSKSTIPTKIILTAFAILLLAWAVQPLAARDYYVDSSGGNDSYDGRSTSTPWRTLVKVNNVMRYFIAGDNIYFKRGSSFRGQGELDITVGGASGSYLTFGAYGTGDKPILDGVICYTPNLGYIVVRDIRLYGGKSGITFSGRNGRNVIISGCDVDYMNNDGIFLQMINTYTIEYCTIRNCTNSGIAIIGSQNYRITNGTIRGNNISNIQDNDGITLHIDQIPSDEVGPNHLLLGNTCYSCGENGVDITSGTYVTLRGNRTYNNAESGTIVWGNTVTDITIDRHYSHDDLIGLLIGGSANIILTSSVIYNSRTYQIVIDPLYGLTNFTAYHNTIVYGPNSSGTLLEIDPDARNLTFKNNIFTSTQYGSPQTYIRYLDGSTPSSTNSHFDYNVYWRRDGNSSSCWNVLGNRSFSTWQNTLGQDIHGQWADPLFINLSGRDYHLQATSPCRDTGTATSVRRDYEGTLIPQGTAPDVGAFEYLGGAPPPPTLQAKISASPPSGEVPLTVNFQGSATGGTPPYSYSWNFNDGQISAAQNPSHTFSETGSYTVTLTVLDSENKSDSDSLKIDVYTKSDYALSAIVSASQTYGEVPLTVVFQGSATGGTPPYSYRWNFNDGQTSATQNPSHTFLNPGSYTVTLTVTDSHNIRVVKTINIKVNEENLTADFSCAPDRIIFGAKSSDSQSPSQHIHILDKALGQLSWSITTNQSWISCSPKSGTGSGKVNVYVNPAGLSPGAHTGKILVSAPNAIISPQYITITFNVYDQDNPPIGAIDSPQEGAFISGSFPISGWALDDIGVTRVAIKRSAHPDDIAANFDTDGLIHLGDAFLCESARPDIQNTYPDYPVTDKAGWGYTLYSYQLPNKGNGSFTIIAMAFDSSGQRAELGRRTIIGTNDSRTLPFGAIDAPENGENISGREYTSLGWILTPPPKSIPADGSTISVWIDGVRFGKPVYNLYSEDIASLFPSYFNSQGAGASFSFNPALFQSGEHTIVWSVTDSNQETDAIDAKYFIIQNKEASPSPPGYSELKGLYKVDTEGAMQLEVDEIRKGYSLELDTNSQVVESGTIAVEVEEMKPVEIRFKTNSSGTLNFFGWEEQEWEALPFGSFLEQEKGVFSWIPTPGFLGSYVFHFAYSDGFSISQPMRVMVNVTPKLPDDSKKKQRQIRR